MALFDKEQVIFLVGLTRLVALCNDRKTFVNLDPRRMSGETWIHLEWAVFLLWIMFSGSWDDLETFCNILSPVWGITV